MICHFGENPFSNIILPVGMQWVRKMEETGKWKLPNVGIEKRKSDWNSLRQGWRILYCFSHPLGFQSLFGIEHLLKVNLHVRTPRLNVYTRRRDTPCMYTAIHFHPENEKSRIRGGKSFWILWQPQHILSSQLRLCQKLSETGERIGGNSFASDVSFSPSREILYSWVDWDAFPIHPLQPIEVLLFREMIGRCHFAWKSRKFRINLLTLFHSKVVGTICID